MATPDSTLQSEIKNKFSKVDQADGGSTIIMEDGGIPATLGLKLRDPFRRSRCVFNDPECCVDPKVDCSKQDQCYILTCNSCQHQVGEVNTNRRNRITSPGGEPRMNYVGMTGTSLHARAKSHMGSVRQGNLRNALAKHCSALHGGVPQKFTMLSMS